MVAKPDIEEARARIASALEEYFQGRGETKVMVAINQYGRLHALIANNSLNGNDPDDVRDALREFLKEKVSSQDLVYLYGIHVLTPAEWDARIVQASGILEGGGASVSGSIKVFNRGGNGKSGFEAQDE